MKPSSNGWWKCTKTYVQGKNLSTPPCIIYYFLLYDRIRHIHEIFLLEDAEFHDNVHNIVITARWNNIYTDKPDI